MSNEEEFRGASVLITGASGGVGAEAVHYFHGRGANVTAVDVNRKALDRVEMELKPSGVESLFLPTDVTVEAEVQELFERVLASFGKIDVVLNVAGVLGPITPTESYPLDAFEHVLRVNVLGPFLTMKIALPHMKAAQTGAIVNVSSVSGVYGVANEIGYGASKAAVVQMTKNAAKEYGAHGVRVNAIAPGWIDTPMKTQLTEGWTAQGRSLASVDFGPAGRAASTLEIVDALAYLASSRASYINGSLLAVDGGMSTR